MTAEGLLERRNGLLDAAHLLAHLARHPVGLAQGIDHRPADAGKRIRLEFGAIVVAVALDRLDQTHHAALDEIVELHVGRQAAHEAQGEALHHRRIRLDQRRHVRFPRLVHHPRDPRFRRIARYRAAHQPRP